MLTREQREARRLCIGGSDWSSILGLPGAYGTPLDVWRSKVEPVTDDDDADYDMDIGNAVEPVILRWFGKDTGQQVTDDQAFIADLPHNPNLPTWWKCQTDGVTFESRLWLPVEAKSVDLSLRKEWGEVDSDQVPIRVIPQIMAQIAYLDVPYGYVTADIAKRRRRHKIMRDESLIAHMLKAGEAFWKLVEEGTPPPPTTSSEANLVWKNHEPGEDLAADPELRTMLTTLRKLKVAEAQVATEREQIELLLKAKIEFREGVKDGDRVLCTWKTQESKRVDTTALKKEQPALAAKYTTVSTTRVLRVKEQDDE